MFYLLVKSKINFPYETQIKGLKRFNMRDPIPFISDL